MSEKITVGLGERSYDIHVGAGLLAQAGTFLKPFARGAVPVVCDTNVEKLHLETLETALKSASIDERPVLVEPGE